MVAFKITEINYLVVSLFCDFVRSFSTYICGTKFFRWAISFVSGIVANTIMTSPKSFTIFL